MKQKKGQSQNEIALFYIKAFGYQPQLPEPQLPELQPPPPLIGLVDEIEKPERGPAST